MSMYAKMMKTTDDRDVDGYMALLHDDYVFVRHQTGTEVSKADWGPAMAEMMASDKLEFFNNRCIYNSIFTRRYLYGMIFAIQIGGGI